MPPVEVDGCWYSGISTTVLFTIWPLLLAPKKTNGVFIKKTNQCRNTCIVAWLTSLYSLHGYMFRAHMIIVGSYSLNNAWESLSKDFYSNLFRNCVVNMI